MTDTAVVTGREGEPSRPVILEFRNIIKTFGGQTAVNDVSFEVRSGEIHGLVGENGAGKSTLVKILAGDHQPDSGEIWFDQERLVTHHPAETADLGIGFIHQVPALVQSLTVAENISLGRSYARNRVGLISWGKHHRAVREDLDRVGLSHVDPRQKLGELSVAERQLVALARVLTTNLRVVVFDEVTAPLTEREVDRLFEIITELKNEGAGILYISHRLEEIFELGDRVTVMKDGSHVATRPVESLTMESLTRLIIGKDPEELFGEATSESGGNVVLSVRGLSDDMLEDVTFDLYEGEILGLAGLGGSGRTPLVRSIFGARQPSRGRILVRGEELDLRNPADAVSNGIGLVTEDRQLDGFIPDAPIWKNITLPWLSDFTRAGFLSLDRERQTAEQAVSRFDIRARSIHSPLRELSGGNQQKAILAKWLVRPLQILLLDEPTHGVDVGAKEEIYKIIRDAASKGMSIILISSELEELEGLCGRVLLLSEGQIVGQLSGEDITEANMLRSLYEAR